MLFARHGSAGTAGGAQLGESLPSGEKGRRGKEREREREESQGRELTSAWHVGIKRQIVAVNRINKIRRT